MADTPIPNPHRDEPVPAPQEGTRPGTDPVVRPEQDEELGPIPGLLSTVGAEVQEEAGLADAEDYDQLDDAGVGVEAEGIEGGQIMGITAAILVSVALIAFVVFWAFYLPELGEAEDVAANEVQLAPEGRTIYADGMARLDNYGLNADSTYTLPITMAMERVVEQREGSAADNALAGDSGAEVPMAVTPQGFNVAPVAIAPARATRSATSRGALVAPVPEVSTASPDVSLDAAPQTDEEVGRDLAPGVDANE